MLARAGRSSGGARAEAEDRAALLEALVLSEDIGETAEHALAWLAARAGARAALCLTLSLDGARLTASAAVGCTAGKYAVELADPGHPLVGLFQEGEARFLESDEAQRARTPLPAGSLRGIPLRARRAPSAPVVGLLLVADRGGDPAPEVVWLADLLAARVNSLRERRFARDRTLLQTVINAVSDPILLTDTEGRIIVSNGRADALFASRDGETEGRSRAVALNNMLFSAALSRTAFDDAEPSRRELLVVDPSEGSDLLFELLSTVVDRGRDGDGVVSVLRNVTDLRRATEEIEENYARVRAAEAEARGERDRLNLIIDSVVDPILVTDPTGNIVLMNQHAERLFTIGPGAEAEEARRAVRLNDAVFSSFASNLYAGQQLRWKGEMTLIDPARGVQLPMESISGKVLSDHGEVSGVVTILHDRSEALEKARLYEQVKRASAELEQKVRIATAELAEQNELLRRQHLQLEQASALKSQFLANVSHELRTPLNAILGYASMLAKGVHGEMSAPQRRAVDRVTSNGRHLLQLIDNLLDIERIESGKMPIHAVEFALPALVAEVVSELEPLADRAGLVVSSDVPSVLPPLETDRQKVKQILVNLLANAIKFTPKGTVRVRARYGRTTDRLTIQVIDTGVGIAPEDQERVFEVFQQADPSTTRSFGGTGLGLAICRRLAGMLGGRISLQSEQGKGSTFTVLLPRKARPS